MPINRREIVREIESQIERSVEVRREAKEFAEDVLDHAKSISPVRTSAYRNAWHLEERPEVRKLPKWAAVNDHPNANLIENGTGPDKPGSNSPFGPDTPTPEFAVAGRTAFHFGGTAP